MDSLWSKTAALPTFPALNRDCKTDVLIIGGGITGILCAHALARVGVDCMLVEAKHLCSGTSENTTAKITAQHGLVFRDLLQKFGLERTALYLAANLTALERCRTLCQGIDCDFETQDSYVYSLCSRQEIDEELEALHQLGYAATLAETLPLPFRTAGAVRFPRQAQFHPLKFLAAVAQGLPIYENTKVLELQPGAAITTGGTIHAENIIVTTHFPLLNKHGGYFLKLYQQRSYVLALQGAPSLAGMYVDGSGSGLSFRTAGEHLLLGGGGHRTGKSSNGWRTLEQFAAQHYPAAQITARWAAQDCMSLDGMPYIGQYSKRTPNLYVATGFNKWGMTSAMVAAELLRDLVLGRYNPCTELFSPARSSLHPQLALNAAEATLSLLTPTKPRCPHMGCALKYNPQEHSWDCPCHGSRFAEDGTLLDNPATDDKRL